MSCRISLCVRPDRAGQAGQSLVEVCIACIALVPLAIGLVYVGQYIHIKLATQMAAREAAWDAAVAPSTYKMQSPDIESEETRLRARYFADASTDIEQPAQAPAEFADTMLLDYSGKMLLEPRHFTLVVYKNEATPGLEGSISKVFDSATRWLSDLPLTHGAPFPPDSRGYITAKADAHTTKAAYFEPFVDLDLHFHSQTVLLADAWDADGGGEDDTNVGRSTDNAHRSPIPDRTVRRTITYLSPATALFGNGLGKGISDVFNVLGSIPVINDFFPMTGFNPGRTAPDVVPYDKLQPYEP